MESPRRLTPRTWIIIAVCVAVLVYTIARIATELMWFASVHYLGVYSKLLTTQIILSLVVGSVSFGAVYGTLRWVRRRRVSSAEHYIGQSAEDFIDKSMVEEHVDKGILAISGIIAALYFLSSFGKSMFVLQWAAWEPFGWADPLFGRDVGFYVFRLPLYEWGIRWLGGLALTITVLAAALHFYEGRVFISARTARVTPEARAHLAIMVALTLVLKGLGYYIAQFALVLRQNALFMGAAYADVHGRLPILRISMALCVIGAVATIVLARRDTDVKRIGYMVAGIFAFAIIGGVAYPGIIQVLLVRPNQASAERPYIERSIASTRAAYLLDDIGMVPYEVSDRLTVQDLAEHKDTVESIRLWDHRPLLATYAQQEQITQYYAFTDIDVDRYRINGRLRQVVLGARELYVYGLPPEARTWVNERLTYTHGYGIAMNPVNEMTTEGLPRYFWSGIPPRRGAGLAEEDMRLTRPEIYFGEFGIPESTTRSSVPQAVRAPQQRPAPPTAGLMAQGNTTAGRPRWPEYVIVRTQQKEFDYPAGNENVYTTYEGADGVPIGTFLRRLAFGIRFRDPSVLLSRQITRESRVLLYRHITERIVRIFPFLAYDRDPYIVVDDEGCLQWITDAYTHTCRYPYSTALPLEGIDALARTDSPLTNYARNSVKAVVDAYNGTVTYYVVDDKDPITRVYAKIFPQLFRPASEMPEDLRRHLRFPRGMFLWQAKSLARFHMIEPDVFYAAEDLWQQANEVAGSKPDAAGGQGGGGAGDWQTRPLDPYYVLLEPPGKDEVEFMLIMPMVRVRRPNMAAWMAAWWDPETQRGAARCYVFPKQSSVYGPMQIESRIDADPAISQQLTLWTRGGSQVIRGNLLAIPIGDTILWVEPLYIQATTESIPSLKKVIVVFGGGVGPDGSDSGRVAMADTLMEAAQTALTRVPTGQAAAQPPAAEPRPEPQAPPPAETSRAEPTDEALRELARILEGMARQQREQADQMDRARRLLEDMGRR